MLNKIEAKQSEIFGAKESYIKQKISFLVSQNEAKMAHSTWQGHTVNKSLYCISFQKEKNSSSRSVQTDSGDPVKLFLHNRLSNHHQRLKQQD